MDNQINANTVVELLFEKFYENNSVEYSYILTTEDLEECGYTKYDYTLTQLKQLKEDLIKIFNLSNFDFEMHLYSTTWREQSHRIANIHMISIDLTEQLKIEMQERILKTKPAMSFIEKKEADIPIDTFTGLYLLGQTTFNPFTGQEYYYLKIGMSKDCKTRMKQYKTTNPAVWHIDFLELPFYELRTTEELYHIELKDTFGIDSSTTEWVLVDRYNYLNICQQGFNAFNLTNKILK